MALSVWEAKQDELERGAPGAGDPWVLRTRDLDIGYRASRRGTKLVAAGLDLDLRRGELVCLLGPNGAGKSTLMRTLAGLQPRLAGSIWIDGVALGDLTARQLARRLAIVLTDRVEVDNLSAWDLVALGRHPYTAWMGTLNDRDQEIVRWALRAVVAGDLARRPLQELSDGERQKVLIARALAQEPLLLLLDEPTAFLDLPRRVEIMGVLRRLARESGRAVLLSTHDLDLALRSGDRLWLLGAEGALHTGAPEDLVLAGAFEQVFASEGVVFDPYTGAFQLMGGSAGIVHLRGDGMAAHWTLRALEREGFCVDRSGDEGARALVVTVDSDAGAPCWRLQRAGVESSHGSIYSLLTALTGSAQPSVPDTR